MRLFQAQNLYGDTSGPPPQPPFFIDREVTRVMPVYLNQYRYGRRLPTPEKDAVLELSNSFERRRLGKHQRILKDISERCRAQEIDDLSNNLSAKVNLHQAERPKEMTLYNTTYMGSRLMSQSPTHGVPVLTTADTMTETEVPNKPNIFETNYKQFPVRRVMRKQNKFEFLRQQTQFQKVEPTVWPKSSVSDSKVPSVRATVAKSQYINGPVQHDSYISPRPDITPLVLPSIERFHVGAPMVTLERSDTCFSTSRIVLGKRSRTQLTINSTREPAPERRQYEPIDLAAIGHEYSQLELTIGNSPLPNSIHEMEQPIT
ncbi:hypothetical protein DPMN_052453 [Dreissena polymorpha]|uniref:Uncharacterized protein n=1 Tax=Dreissena polymorpha TaxID=45954 RepID=A0A9D4CKX8_DREPO|nr:hypothetical protein DPMN_052273 [Dreissena polymorpha]KAH3726586.1 hypothetical protein DPMN_052453 [Dreissena polymorpha]